MRGKGSDMTDNHEIKAEDQEDGARDEQTQPEAQAEVEAEAEAVIETEAEAEAEDVNHAEAVERGGRIVNMVRRAMAIEDRAVDSDDRTVWLGVSTEEPVARYDGLEIIDHSAESMNLEWISSGRAPLLLDHDMERQVGVVEFVELDEDARRLRAKVRLGKGALASEVLDDVADGIRQNVSVGYRIDGRINARDGDPDGAYRVLATPMEVSLVSIPADRSSLTGVGRSYSEPVATDQKKEGNQMSEVDMETVRREAAEAARKDAKDIMVLARKHNKASLGEDAVGRGLSLDQFRGELLDVIGDAPLDTPAHVVEVTEKERKEYSLSRMLSAQLDHNWQDAGFEREMHDEIVSRTGKQPKGVYVPDFAWQERAGPMATGATGAVANENVISDLVPTVHREDMFIEALRAKQVAASLGVRFIGGLTNRLNIPGFSAGAQAGFVEELGNVADQSQTTRSVTLQPRTMGAFVDMGRLAIKESVPAIDALVRDDLLMALADCLENEMINGSTVSGGGLMTASIGNLDISAGTDVDALTWADIVGLVKLVEEANGIRNRDAIGFLSSPGVKAKMASTARVSGTDSVMLLEEPWTSVYGHPIEFTTNVRTNYDPGDGGNDASALIFGDFSQAMVGLFGAPDILVDETTGGLAGTVRIIVHQDVDINYRHLASFAKTDEVSVA